MAIHVHVWRNSGPIFVVPVDYQFWREIATLSSRIWRQIFFGLRGLPIMRQIHVFMLFRGAFLPLLRRFWLRLAFILSFVALWFPSFLKFVWACLLTRWTEYEIWNMGNYATWSLRVVVLIVVVPIYFLCLFSIFVLENEHI